MSIHVYIWLCIENEEEVSKRKRLHHQLKLHLSGVFFYFDIRGKDPDSPTTQGKPRCIYLSL
jgi:hypothetical protein